MSDILDVTVLYDKEFVCGPSLHFQPFNLTPRRSLAATYFLHVHLYISISSPPRKMKCFGLWGEISRSNGTNIRLLVNLLIERQGEYLGKIKFSFWVKSSGVLEHLVVTKCQSLFSHGLPLYIGVLILKLVNKQTHTHTTRSLTKQKILISTNFLFKNSLNSEAFLLWWALVPSQELSPLLTSR